MTVPKIVTIDIETSALECWTWGLFDQNIGLDMVKTEWSILSYAAKPYGSNRVLYKDTGGRGKRHVRNDKELLKSLWKILDDADIVIAQNGKKFDLRKINSRMAMYNIPPYSPVRMIDTLEVAKRHFKFTSNKLAWLSQFLTDSPKDKHKDYHGFELWKACLNDDPKAWRSMKKYNKQDVIATEKVYNRLRPWITSHPNMAMYTDGKVPVCPKCGSTHINKRGFVTTNSTHYQRYQCASCKGWSRSKQLLTSTSKRKLQLVAI